MARRGARSDAPSADRIPNLGPVSRRWLSDVGVQTMTDLERIGSIDAYRAVRALNGAASLNLLYAMEAALLGIDWRDLPVEIKSQLKAKVADDG